MAISLPDPADVPFLTIGQAAECLGISRRAAYRAVDRLELPTVDMGWRMVPTAYLYDITRQTPPGEPQPPRVITLADDAGPGNGTLTSFLSL